MTAICARTDRSRLASAVEVLLKIVDRAPAARRSGRVRRAARSPPAPCNRNTDDECRVALFTGRDVCADDVAAERLRQVERLLRGTRDAVRVRDLDRQRRADRAAREWCPARSPWWLVLPVKARLRRSDRVSACVGGAALLELVADVRGVPRRRSPVLLNVSSICAGDVRASQHSRARDRDSSRPTAPRNRDAEHAVGRSLRPEGLLAAARCLGRGDLADPRPAARQARPAGSP